MERIKRSAEQCAYCGMPVLCEVGMIGEHWRDGTGYPDPYCDGARKAPLVKGEQPALVTRLSLAETVKDRESRQKGETYA